MHLQGTHDSTNLDMQHPTNMNFNRQVWLMLERTTSHTFVYIQCFYLTLENHVTQLQTPLLLFFELVAIFLTFQETTITTHFC